ncbi:tetratricopeptide repeat protein [Amycolatopsis sp. SID8362]|uniref:tetratricopeptide repeat protein n=1 Tax=Amycolatopsis sp. SID8362 TaxID=2690346 RepID=UPI00136D8AEC|nr:tetratricopeptide repeat protein [Amycolatopsis sp. SID8362]NBH02905.1 tetratricopeptide repeat protein [Amycolatopsis sp. SID8362]NED39606.1 tetratricopeptide repeat protein [Amycolatopsis sp. SID8362]
MVVPHEVPLGPRVFVNRLPDFGRMAAFWELRRPGAPRIGVCSGLPGVGKTAFVRRCVQGARDADAFPGGDLHVDFGPVDGERLSVSDALASCLNALGVAREVLPASLAERANQLRTITAHRPVLLVLEDVTDAAQVLPFVPNSQASAVLVTSSGRLSELIVDGAEPIPLEPLDGEDGAHLLRELVGPRAEAEPGAVAELVRQCAGLPVALKVVAARLVARPALSIASLAQRIAEDDGGLNAFTARGQEKVSAVFSAAYDALSAEAARLYRLLGLVPGPDLPLDVVASVVDRPRSVVAELVESLDDAGLLSVGSTGRLSLHPMVRRHAAHLARLRDPADEQDAALRRLVDHLLVKAAFADQAVLGAGRYRCTPAELTRAKSSPFTGPGAKAAALDWLDTERQALLAAQRLAAEQGRHTESWQLAEALTALYVTKRYLVDWTISSELGASSARHVGNSRAEARLRSFVSRAWTDLGRLDRAEDELITKALPIAEESADVRLRASVWELVGRFRDETAPEAAAEAYEHAIELFSSQDDARGVAFVTFFLGCSLHRSGRRDLAEETLRRSLPLIRAVPDTRMEGRCLTELGAVLFAAGRPDLAHRELTQAVALLTRGGYPYFEAQAHEKLLAIAEADGEVADARAALTRLAEIHLNLGSSRAADFRERLDRLTPA